MLMFILYNNLTNFDFIVHDFYFMI